MITEGDVAIENGRVAQDDGAVSDAVDIQPMDHRDLLALLSSEQRHDLTRKSDLRGFENLSLHWGAILALGWLIAAQVPLWPFLMAPQGILIVFLFTPLHETTHKTAFATRWINRSVAWICGFLLLLPPEWFRQFHFAHHRYTQEPKNDPELQATKPETVPQYLLHISGLPLWWSHLKTLGRNALGMCDDAFVPAPARDKMRKESLAMVLAYGLLFGASIASGSAALIYVWLLPAVFGQPFLRLYLMAEHGRCPHVANMLENTRTTLTNALVRKLAWNMPYHTEHHVYPSVPFYRLPELHELTRPHLHVTANGYLRFHGDLLRAIRGRGPEISNPKPTIR